MSQQDPAAQDECCPSCSGGCNCGYDSSAGEWCECPSWCSCKTCRPMETIECEPIPGPDGRPVCTMKRRGGLTGNPEKAGAVPQMVPAVPDYRGAVEQGWEPGSYISSKEAEGLEKTTSDAMHGDQHEPAPEKK